MILQQPITPVRTPKYVPILVQKYHVEIELRVTDAIAGLDSLSLRLITPRIVVTAFQHGDTNKYFRGRFSCTWILVSKKQHSCSSWITLPIFLPAPARSYLCPPLPILVRSLHNPSSPITLLSRQALKAILLLIELPSFNSSFIVFVFRRPIQV